MQPGDEQRDDDDNLAEQPRGFRRCTIRQDAQRET